MGIQGFGHVRPRMSLLLRTTGSRSQFRVTLLGSLFPHQLPAKLCECADTHDSKTAHVSNQPVLLTPAPVLSHQTTAVQVSIPMNTLWGCSMP